MAMVSNTAISAAATLLLLLICCPNSTAALITSPQSAEASNRKGILEDEDIRRGEAYRREEFYNQDETAFQRNIQLINEKRHRHSDWTVEGNCRVNSGNDLGTTQCIDGQTASSSPPPQCFSTPIHYNYTMEQNDTFGPFPGQLEFLRHFPRCWLRLAPLVCLAHFRPCVMSTRNYVGALYVLLQQFPTMSCLNMLDHCPFASAHLLAANSNLPGYLDCSNKAGGKERALYTQDCKVNYLAEHAELAALANASFQCLWPLVSVPLDEHGEEGSRGKATPLIDGCFMPCQSALFPSDGLYVYNFFSSAWFALIAVVTALTAFKLIAMHGKKLPVPLLLTLTSTFGSICAAASLLAMSSLPLGDGRVFGELATCLDGQQQPNGGGRHIRRFPNGFRMPEGRDNAICAIQATALNFFLLFVDSSFVLLALKLLLCLPRLAKPARHLLPKWHSPLLPVSPLLYAILIAAFELFFVEVSVDPVDGICHFFYPGQSFSSLGTFSRTAWTGLVTLLVAILLCYLNWVLERRKTLYLRKSRSYKPGRRRSPARNDMAMSMLELECRQALQQNHWDQQKAEKAGHDQAGDEPKQKAGDEHEKQQQNGDIPRKSMPMDGQEGQQELLDGEKEMNHPPALEEPGEAEAGAGTTVDERAPLRTDPEDAMATSARFKGTFCACTPWKWTLNCLNSLLDFIYRWLGPIFALWLFLQLARVGCGQMQIGPEEEAALILKSINCSLDRSLSEGVSLDWINRQVYRDSAETNPHVRRRLLGGNLSARYCDLEQFSLHWYWANTLLLGHSLLLVVATLCAIVSSSSEHLRLEQELEAEAAEEAVAQEVEMQEMRRKKEGKKRRGWSAADDGNDSANDRSSSSNDYARISSYDAEASVTSTWIPASTLPPPSFSAAAAHAQQPRAAGNWPEGVPMPPFPPTAAAMPDNNGIHNNNDGTAPLAQALLNFLQFAAAGQAAAGNNLAEEAYSKAFSDIYSYFSYQNQQVQLQHEDIDKAIRWFQANCNYFPCPGIATCGMEDPRLRRRAGSDPGTSSQGKQLNPTQNGEKKTRSSTRSSRSHHKLYIRRAPRELLTEWRREGRQRRASGTALDGEEADGNGTYDGGSDLSSAYNAVSNSQRKSRRTMAQSAQVPGPSHRHDGGGMDPCQLQQLANAFSQLHQMPPPMPWANNNNSFPGTPTQFGMQMPRFPPNPFQMPMMPQFPPFCPSCGISHHHWHSHSGAGCTHPMAMQQQQQPPQNGFNHENAEEDEAEDGTDCDEPQREEEHGDDDDDDDAEDDAKSVPRTNSPEPSTTLPSSTCEEDGEEEEDGAGRNSDDFDSDSSDSFEEKRWAELTKQAASTTSSSAKKLT